MRTIALGILFLVAYGCARGGVLQETDLCHSGHSVLSNSFEKTSNGSVVDLKRAIASLQCFDSGDLEDAHIAIGIGLFKFPGRFATQLRSGDLNKNDLVAITTMLPSNFVDEPCKAAAELSRREKLIHDADLFGPLKSPVLNALNQSEQLKTKYCKPSFSDG